VFGGWQQQLTDSQQLLLLQQQHEGAAAAVHQQQMLAAAAAAAGAAGLPGSGNMGPADMLDFEPSLNGGAIEALAGGAGFGTLEGAAALMSNGAAGLAVDIGDINPEFSLGMSNRAAAAAAAADGGGVGDGSSVPFFDRGGSRGVSPDAAAIAASQVHQNMWASYEANRMRQLAEQQQQQLDQMHMQHHMQQLQVQQQMQQLQVQQQMQQEALMRSSGSFTAAAAELAAREQAFAAAAAAASRRYEQDARVQSPVPESYWTAPVDSQVVLQQLANRPDAAAIAVRAAAASGTPFTVPGDAALPMPQQLKLHLSDQEQAAAAALLAAGAGAAAGASIEVVGPMRPPELSQPWLSSWEVQNKGAAAAYLPQQYTGLVQHQQEVRDREELTAYDGIWTKQLCQQQRQQGVDAARDTAVQQQQQQQQGESASVASRPQLPQSNASSAAASPRSPGHAEHSGATTEQQQLLLVQAQIQSQQLTQRSAQLLLDMQQMAAMQQLAMLQPQQQQVAVEGRHHSQTMGRLSPLGDLARSCSGSIKPASPAAAGAESCGAIDLGTPVVEQQQMNVAARAAAALRGEALTADQLQQQVGMLAPGHSSRASSSSGAGEQSQQTSAGGCAGPAAVASGGGSRCKAGCVLDGIPEVQGLESRSSNAADDGDARAQ
jgi:hypothetical protein